MNSQALVPVLLSRTEHKIAANIFALMGGILLLTLLAQISISLPWTPVPITGQTLGVSMIGLAWGWRRSFAVVGTYLLLGGLGLPVFAPASATPILGPTFGYLIGMLIAASVEGWLGDLGFTKKFWQALATAYVGSAFIFSCGLFVLSFYVPGRELLWAGLYPFLIGDLMKNLTAAGVRSQMQKMIS